MAIAIKISATEDELNAAFRLWLHDHEETPDDFLSLGDDGYNAEAMTATLIDYLNETQ